MATKRTTEPTQPRYLVVTEERQHGYYHLYGRITTQRYESGEIGQWLPYGLDDEYGDGLLWTGLRVSCQGDTDSQRRVDGRDVVYGYDRIEYVDVHTVDARRARRMVRTLDAVERKLQALRETRGYVKSYGEYCGRVAEVCGCGGMAILQARGEGRRSAGRWDWLSVGDGVNRVNHAIYLWQREALGDEAARPAADSEVA